MTRIKVTYVAMDADHPKPILTAESMKDLKKGLDEYFRGECLGFFPYESKYPDDYEGYYKYKWTMTKNDGIEEYVDEIKVYCIEFFPYTKIIH